MLEMPNLCCCTCYNVLTTSQRLLLCMQTVHGDSHIAESGKGYQQALATPQEVDSVEGIPGHDSEPTQFSDKPDGYGRQGHKHHAGQQTNSNPNVENQMHFPNNEQSQQKCTDPQIWDFESRRVREHPHDSKGASQTTVGHPQSSEGAAPESQGHPQQLSRGPSQRLSSRRRSMERPSASLTLPFEQLNFAFHHIHYSVPATVRIRKQKCMLHAEMQYIASWASAADGLERCNRSVKTAKEHHCLSTSFSKSEETLLHFHIQCLPISLLHLWLWH